MPSSQFLAVLNANVGDGTSLPFTRNRGVYPMTTSPMTLTAVLDRVCTVTLNRPDDLNPLSWQVLDELAGALESCRHNPEVGVIVIEAAGKAFSTGYDLREEHWITSQYPANFPERIEPVAGPRRRACHRRLLDEDVALPKTHNRQGPRETACQGRANYSEYAIWRLLASGPASGIPQGRDLGIPPSIMFWPMLIGYRKTKELLYTGKLISAHDAEKIGLVNEVVPHEALE